MVLLLLTVLSWLFMACPTSAMLTNVTIDDQFGDLVSGITPVYTPITSWSLNGCGNCTLPPNSTSAYRETWHFAQSDIAGTSGNDLPRFMFKFKGTAVYLYFVIQNNVPTRMQISLNGSVWANYYSQVVDTGADFLYNVSILSVPSLPFGEHTLSASPDAIHGSATYFDYAVYTTPAFNVSGLMKESSGLSPSEQSVMSPSEAHHAPTVTAAVTRSSDLGLSAHPSFVTPPWLDSNAGNSKVFLLSSHNRRSVFEPNSAILISSVVGGAGVLINLLLILVYCLYCRRRSRRHPMYKIEPYTHQRAFPEESIIEPPTSAKWTESAASTRDLVRRSYQGTLTSEDGTLTTEIPVPPSEVEDVYYHLDTLSAELHGMRAGEKGSEAGAGSTVTTYSAHMQAGIAVLRAEVDRLRSRSVASEQPSGQTSPSVDLMDMLRELDVLRVEVEGMLMQPSEVTVERLPSYKSRLTSAAYITSCPPPPLPTPPLPLRIKS